MMANLKKLRMERNLTQAQLGEILGVQGQTVLNWENDLSSPKVGFRLTLRRK